MSASLEQIIGSTQTLQDVELATAISALRSNPSEFQAFLQDQQNKVYSSITKQKDDTFQKVYGDLDRASKVEESILMHNRRAKELAALQQQVYQNQENSATAVVEDKNMATRKKEMNEWTVQNKQDTLFVVSWLFIVLSGLLLITALWRMGWMSSYLWAALGVPLIIIFLLILIRRWRYTDVLRNKRYWNKQIFEGKYDKINIPSCPGVFGESVGTPIPSSSSSSSPSVSNPSM
jgi:hypothetical protein